jgi:hypothetical protein
MTNYGSNWFQQQQRRAQEDSHRRFGQERKRVEAESQRFVKKGRVQNEEAMKRMRERRYRRDRDDWCMGVDYGRSQQQWLPAAFRAQSGSQAAGTGMQRVRRRILVVAIAVVLLVLSIIAATAIYLHLRGTANAAISRTTGGVTVSSAHVRTGPGTTYAIVGTLNPRRRLQIACQAGTVADPWDRLASPYSGRYVGANLIQSVKPPPCP